MDQRMQNRYTDVQLAWPDVNCASRLCEGGPIEYVCKQRLGLTQEWLCNYVTPNIVSVFGIDVGAILAKPLLWACFDSTWAEKVNPSIRQRIISAFLRLDHGDDENPVDRVEVLANQGRNGVAIERIEDFLSNLTRQLSSSINYN